MRALRRLLFFFLALALAALAIAGAALANHLDPKKRITPADQARARAMLLKKTDLPAPFRAVPRGGGEPHIDCPQVVSEADLTVTGDAEGTQFVLGPVSVNSASQVYESAADASASWRRGTSPAGTRCLTHLLRQEFQRQGVRLVSLRKTAFPQVSERTVAYRVTLSAETSQGAVPLYADVVVLSRSRALAQVFVASGLVPPDRGEEIRLARLVAGRMARAMRGG
jgi:hypothetical protein